nr:DUF1593 domain-containing protein [Cytophagales bacterium]
MPVNAQQKPRVIVSSDIGGTDDDDFQSLIHYLMYADRFQTEGLIASPFGPGRKSDILHILDLYEEDFSKLASKSRGFPLPDDLRAVTKQGAIGRAPLKGWTTPTEGSSWIIQCAKKELDQPLWVLVWGGLEDVAQALHDAPDITDKLRVYWIGGPNKKWSADAYQYIAANFPKLWMIEANATYRGLFVDDNTDKATNVTHFYEAYIKGKGAMAGDFVNYYGGRIKMGDTPSVAYLLHGDPYNPRSESWGGSFERINHSSRRLFTSNTSLKDTVPTFSLMEWEFKGKEVNIHPDSSCFVMEIANQQFEGYYKGGGRYAVRFVTKSAGDWAYRISSQIPELDGQEGAFVSTDPWPGEHREGDIKGLSNWWSDRSDEADFADGHQGARTVFRFQEDFLMDWADRWDWLE